MFDTSKIKVENHVCPIHPKCGHVAELGNKQNQSKLEVDIFFHWEDKEEYLEFREAYREIVNRGLRHDNRALVIRTLREAFFKGARGKLKDLGEYRLNPLQLLYKIREASKAEAQRMWEKANPELAKERWEAHPDKPAVPSKYFDNPANNPANNPDRELALA